jgi:hypothetical protein
MERSPKLSEAVDFGINSTYLQAHMPKSTVPLSKFVKILKKFSKSSQKVLKKFSKSSQKVLKKFSKSSQKVLAQKFSIVTYPRRSKFISHKNTNLCLLTLSLTTLPNNVFLVIKTQICYCTKNTRHKIMS